MKSLVTASAMLNGCALTEHWESSTDDGATWATVFDGSYQPGK
jgi:hypothetical protein